MWIAERTVKADSDESYAMGYAASTGYQTKQEARIGLVVMIANEIGSWVRMGLDASREVQCLAEITSGKDSASFGGVTWKVREY